MTLSYRNLLAAVAGAGLLIGAAAPAMADMPGMGAQRAPSAQQAHMQGGQGPQGGPGYGMQGMPCPMMGQGMMGQGHGPGMMMGPGMMGPGMMGQGYGPGMMGQGPGMMMQPGYGMGPGMMMGPGYGGGMMGPGYGPGYQQQAPRDLDLTTDDVRSRLEGMIAWHGNDNVKVGDVEQADDGTIVADIVTKDGSLVRRFQVDRSTGAMRPVR